MTYKILFIDEQKEAHREFSKGFLDHNKDRFTGMSAYPLATVAEMIDFIFKENPDAVLTDYSLNEYKTGIDYEVLYNGGDLEKEMHERRSGFPFFITTGLGDDAAMSGADVKLIYEKIGSFREGQKDNNKQPLDRQHLTFSDKLFHEIKSYKKYLDDISNEFDSLHDKRNSNKTGLSLAEEKRLIELDGILENLIDKKSKIPSDLKMTTNDHKLEELISLAKKIVGEK